MAKHNALGAQGEALAVQFLKKEGYRILEQNYRFRKAEIDIIALTGNTLVAVEVKTRSTADFGDPQSFLKPAQIRRIVKALDYYITDKDLDFEVRFDVMAIVKNRKETTIKHIENAFLFFQ